MFHPILTLLRQSLLTGIGLVLLAASSAALALEGRLVILTSFPEDLSGLFQRAFEPPSGHGSRFVTFYKVVMPAKALSWR